MASDLLSSKAVEKAKCKLDSLTGKPRETLLSDGNGLYLRLRPTPTHTIREWVFIYTAARSKRRKITLGGYPDHALSDARAWARNQRQIIDNGIDPLEAKNLARNTTDQRSLKTLTSLLDAYLLHLEKKGKSTREQRSIFKCHIPRDLLGRPASSIHRNEITNAVRIVLDKGLNRTADKLRAYVGAAYNAALSADSDPLASRELMGFGLEANPVALVKPIPDGGSQTCDRVLSNKELGDYLEAISLLPDGDEKDLLLMQIFTAGQRFRQLAGATLQILNGNIEAAAIDSKGRRSKPRSHYIPLTGPALIIYERRGKLFEYADERNKNGGLDRGPLTRFCDNVSRRVTEMSEQLLKEEKISSPFKAGAVRRSAETWLMSQRYSREQVGQLLSHGIVGIQAKHYDRHDYREIKLEMLQRWHSYLLEVLPDGLAYLNPKIHPTQATRIQSSVDRQM
jgi:Arm DNA-binding domain